MFRPVLCYFSPVFSCACLQRATHARKRLYRLTDSLSIILVTRASRDLKKTASKQRICPEKKRSLHIKLRHFIIQHLKPPEITVQFVCLSTYIYTPALLKCSVQHEIVQPVLVHSVTSRETIYLPLQLMEQVQLFDKPSSKFGVAE